MLNNDNFPAINVILNLPNTLLKKLTIYLKKKKINEILPKEYDRTSSNMERSGMSLNRYSRLTTFRNVCKKPKKILNF